MHRTPSRLRSPRTRRAAAAVVAVAAVVAAANAASSSAVTTRHTALTPAQGVAEAKKLVAAAKTEVKFTRPGPAFDASKARGKVVFNIANGLQIPFNVELLKGTGDAFDLVGVKQMVFDSKGDVSEIARLFSLAISQHADAIVAPSTPYTLIAAPLAEAKKAGIPVVQRFSSDPRLPTPEEKAAGVSAIVSYCFKCAGKLQADYAIADGNGNVKAVTYWGSSAGSAFPQVDGIKEELARLCASCSVSLKDLPFSQWPTQIPTLTQTSLLDTSINYFLPLYDGMTQFMIPAIHAGNAEKRVKIVSVNADTAPMQVLASGDVLAAEVGTPIRWAGWAVADQVLRLLTKQPAVADEKVPLKLFDRSNLPDLRTKELYWYGVNFPREYMKLWGLTKTTAKAKK